jgi:hypothetical protein
VKIVRPKTVPAPPAPAPGPGAPSPAPETRTRPLVPPRAPNSAKAKNKVLLSVLDGRIEWEKMTAESRKAFEDLFKDKEFLSQFGLTGKEKAFDPEQMKALYDGISMMYKTVVGMFLRWPPAALQMLAYSDEQKTMLAGPTANLANKFAPAFLVKHQELLIWGGMFAAVTQANFIQASGEAKKLIQQQRANQSGARPAIVAPQRQNPADRPAPSVSVPFGPPPINGEGDPASLG